MTYYCPTCGADTQGQSVCPNWSKHPGVNTGAGTMTTMTKDQAIAYLHPHVNSSHNEDWKTKREAWDVLMAHLAPREVSDEDVERAITIYWSKIPEHIKKCVVSWNGDAETDAMRAALQADRQRGCGVVPSERVYAPLPSDADEYDRGHVDGWNACRQAMLSKRVEVE